jgi:hypothetical protein
MVHAVVLTVSSRRWFSRVMVREMRVMVREMSGRGCAQAGQLLGQRQELL